jgi:hypothetical protein
MVIKMEFRRVIIILVLIFASVNIGIVSANASVQGGESQSKATASVNEKTNEAAKATSAKKSAYTYPITLAPATGVTPVVQWWGADANTTVNIVTVIGRMYLSQKQAESSRLLELQSDNAVIFLLDTTIQTERRNIEGVLAGGAVKAVYLSGDVVMTEGQRTIRADEMYYDFQDKKALANNVVMRTFDETGNIPIYLRAKQLKQVAENKFTAEDITLTTSEFYTPQLALEASEISLTDITSDQGQDSTESKRIYDARMRDVRLQLYDKTIFYLPFIRSTSERPDIPLKSLHVGYDNSYGTYTETRWYLARILGLQEPQGTSSTLMLDYYSDKGPAGGIQTRYEAKDYFGKLIGYIVDDKGEDWLGRQRKNLDPPNDIRGRFSWRHRQFLPYDWQLTAEVGYLSDENFLESYYRTEFNLDKEQETLLYLKRLDENRGISILNKFRINDFETQLNELPTIKYHWTGESFLDDIFTFYSDTQVSRLQRQYSSNITTGDSEAFYTFLSNRNEIDLPLALGRTKIVPYTAVTTAFEDGTGFYRDIDGSQETPEDEVWYGEGGVRMSAQPYWKVMPDVESRLWDLNRMRHIIRPYMSAAGYIENNPVIDQRDAVNFGITQQLQTKRGPATNQRTVDWMRLDTSITIVDNAENSSPGTDRFIWNRPYIPLINELSKTAIQQDRRGSSSYGARNNSFTADYAWHLSDTTAIFSDLNYDLYDNVVQQYDVGLSHIRWPNLGYYIGNRYLRDVDTGYEEKSSNALTYAVTYLLDPRYTLVYAGQYDLDGDTSVRNEITLIRKYHRLFWSITYSTDAALDRQSVTFSIWPQGLPDLAVGTGRYMEVGGTAEF